MRDLSPHTNHTRESWVDTNRRDTAKKKLNWEITEITMHQSKIFKIKLMSYKSQSFDHNHLHKKFNATKSKGFQMP